MMALEVLDIIGARGGLGERRCSARLCEQRSLIMPTYRLELTAIITARLQ